MMMPSAKPVILPSLRQDLQIIKSQPFLDGAPSWLVMDRLGGGHLRIDRAMLEMLHHWQAMEVNAFVEHLANKAGLTKSAKEITETAALLYRHNLAAHPPGEDYRHYLDLAQRRKKSTFRQLFEKTMFFRISLGSPRKFLNVTWPLVAPLFGRGFVFVSVMIALVGLYLVSRQWDHFIATFQGFLTFEGMAAYALAMLVLKIIHELGHAYMARRYKVDVPDAGLAFMMFMPVLYTSTSEAWRLDDGRKRLMIDFGGIFAELVIAAWATLAWVLLPDGSARSVAFIFASLSWLTSLAVNLNPLMRFDGYYILCDWLGMENLQERGFAMARWRLREWLFGFGEAPPEALPRNYRRIIVLHAYAVWIYRFFLYLGIAWLVYAKFFKLLGLAMFVSEIVFFIVFPVMAEATEWWKRRNLILLKRRIPVGAILLVGGLLFVFVPWSGRVDVPVMIEARSAQTIFARESGVVAKLAVHAGMRVEKGDPLIVIHSHDQEFRLRQANLKMAMNDAKLRRLAADVETRAIWPVLLSEQKAIKGELNGLNLISENLRLAASTSGIVRDFLPGLTEGMTVSANQPLFVIINGADHRIRGLVNEAGRARIVKGDKARFVPDEAGDDSIALEVIAVSPLAAAGIDMPLLADVNGGNVPSAPMEAARRSRLAEANALQPRGNWFGVEFVAGDTGSAEKIAALAEITRGVAIVSGRRESLATRMARRIALVAIRESGF